MNKKLKTAISFIIALIILYLIYSRLNFHYFLKVLKDMNVYYFVIALVLSFAGFYVVAYRWQILLKNMGLKAKLHDLTVISIIFYFSNCILPARLGEIYRCYLIKKNYNFPGSKVLGGIFVERIIDIKLLVIIFAFLAYMFFKDYFVIIYYAIAFVVFVMIVAWVLVYYRAYIISKLPKIFKDKFHNFQRGMRTCVRKENIVLIIVMSVFRWFMTIVPIYFVFLALGINLSWVIITFMVIASNIVAIIPLTPAGMGVSELTIIGILIMAGITQELSIATSFVVRFVNYWSVLIVGGIIYLGSDKK